MLLKCSFTVFYVPFTVKWLFLYFTQFYLCLKLAKIPGTVPLKQKSTIEEVSVLQQATFTFWRDRWMLNTIDPLSKHQMRIWWQKWEKKERGFFKVN